ncbi:MAG: transposase [Alphaproteobacteria bacterium]|nr:transposase [Alphaproteobacteria bacterium]
MGSPPVLDTNLFNTLTEVQQATNEWVEDYNQIQPHQSVILRFDFDISKSKYRAAIFHFCTTRYLDPFSQKQWSKDISHLLMA